MILAVSAKGRNVRRASLGEESKRNWYYRTRWYQMAPQLHLKLLPKASSLHCKMEGIKAEKKNVSNPSLLISRRLVRANHYEIFTLSQVLCQAHYVSFV